MEIAISEDPEASKDMENQKIPMDLALEETQTKLPLQLFSLDQSYLVILLLHNLLDLQAKKQRKVVTLCQYKRLS